MRFKRKEILLGLLARTLSAALCLLPIIIGMSMAVAADRPNIVLILADDLGYGDLSCYEARDIATPNFDRMAVEGAKFNRCYVSPVCSPTRGAYCFQLMGRV